MKDHAVSKDILEYNNHRIEYRFGPVPKTDPKTGKVRDETYTYVAVTNSEISPEDQEEIRKTLEDRFPGETRVSFW